MRLTRLIGRTVLVIVIGATLGGFTVRLVASRRVTPVRLGFEMAGARFTMRYRGADYWNLFVFDAPVYSTYYFQVRQAGSLPITIDDMSKLQGLVTIKSAADALRFVRIRTLPLTCMSMRDAIVEVISIRHVGTIPTYGSGMRITDDDRGVVSQAVYQRLHASAPTVTAVRGGYRIRRTIFGPQVGYVSVIQETVTPNGGYACNVVSSTLVNDIIGKWPLWPYLQP